jgi:hypothetical protein
VKLDIKVTLDSGGTITITGEDLTAEGVNEVFAILGGYTVEGETELEPQDEPLPGPITEDMKDSFVEGFNEGRKQEEKT